MSAIAPSASPARLRLDRVAWMLLPAAPFAAVLAMWAVYWQIARPPAATLPCTCNWSISGAALITMSAASPF